MNTRLFSLFVALAAFAAHAQAGVIQGQLRDTHGAPVASAILQFDPMSGGGATVFVTGGITDANGHFSATVTPDGAYRMTVFPLPPPQSSVVSQQFTDMNVGLTTNDLGVLVLANGIEVAGRVVGATGTPLVSVGLEFKTPADTQWRSFTNGETDASGHFRVNVPTGPCQIGFEPGPVPYYGGPDAGPRSLSVDSTSNLDVGDVAMPLGYTITTSAVRSSDGSPVDDARVEFIVRATGEIAYTPHNRTDPAGHLTMPVAAGNYDVRFIAPNNDGLLPGTLTDRTVPQTTALGTIALQDGIELRGRVRGSDNTGYPGITVEVRDHTTQAALVLDNAVTNVTGNYSVIVPSGTYDVSFLPPFSLPFGAQTVTSVLVDSHSSHVSLNGTLPSVPFSSLIGIGTPGLGGITPQIGSVGGAPRLGNALYTLSFTQARGAATGVVAYTIRDAGPHHGPQPYLRQVVALEGTPGAPGTGSGTLTVAIPNDPMLIGRELHAVLMVRDGASGLGFCATQELVATIQP